MAHDPAHRLRVWSLALRLARLGRRSLGVVGLLVAAWLVLLGLRVLRTGEGGDTWLLAAGLAWLGAALRFPPFLLLRADVGDMEPTLPAWAGALGVSGLGYALVGPRHGDVAVVWIHPVVYPAGARYPRMVRRVIGVPGDRVAIRHGQVWRNGTALAEPYCRTPFPADSELGELQVPPRHYLVLPDHRAGSLTQDASLEGAGWLLGAEHLIGRGWFGLSRRHEIQAVPRSWPWLDPLGLVLGPVVWMLRDCWAQIRGRPRLPAPGDDEPARVHGLCEDCQGRAWPVPRPTPRRGGLPPGFRWVTPSGLEAPRRPGPSR